MSGVPIGFPFKLDDDNLERAIAETLEPANWHGFDNFTELPLALKVEMVAAGLHEQERREQARSASRALRAAYATLATSIIALLVAVIVAVLSAVRP